MSAWSRFLSLFAPPPPRLTVFAPVPKLILTQACLEAVQRGVEPEMRKGHEGIVYLLGRTDGVTALATTVFRPEAITTPGSFHVEPRAMAACVQAAGQFELQVAGQLHTHPDRLFTAMAMSKARAFGIPATSRSFFRTTDGCCLI